MVANPKSPGRGGIEGDNAAPQGPVRAVPIRPARPDVARAKTDPGTSPRTRAEAPSAGDAWHESDGVLVIGEGIEVKGEIGSCRALVVEGRLEASVVVEELHLAESGHYSGTAGVGTADVAGRFDGELTVEGDLRLRPTARVKGKIRYGRIIVEAGGQISGDVAVRGGGEGA